jgi:hypothetical protein
MLRQMSHRYPLANGYSGYGLPHQGIFEFGLRDLDPSVLAAYQTVAPVAVLVTRDRADDAGALAMMNSLAEARRIAVLPAGTLYQLPQTNNTIASGGGRRLRIASIAFQGGLKPAAANPALLDDDDPVTRWENVPDRQPDDHVDVTLAEASPITRVELDLGRYGLEYPRSLRISLGSDRLSLSTVWEGRTAGLALLGALRDPRRMPIAIDLPPGAAGRELRLTLLEEHPAFSWSIADLRVFGR